MKKLFLPLLSLFLIVSCSTNEQYTIKGELEGSAGEVIYLQEYTGGSRVNIDSAVLVDGSFEFAKGSVDIPSMYYLSIEGKRGSLGFFLENSEISISGHADTLYNATTAGSETHDQYIAYGEGLKPLQEKSNKLYLERRAAQQEGNEELVEEISASRDEVTKEINIYIEDFIAANPSSYITPVILRSKSYNMTTDELEEEISKLDAALYESQIIKDMLARIEALRKVEIGQIAPDFTQNDVDGNPLTLSEIKGHKLLLIDFWAAWCGPCRKENPHVVAVYNEFHEAGFDVLGVSLDNEKEAWLKAIEDDMLPWNQVSDLGGWGNVVAKQYAVNSIPANFLLDADGKILATGLRGEKLKEKVAELLAE